MLDIREERMAPFFTKYHVGGLPCAAVFHTLGVDHGDPHSHPWPFTSFVVHGGYREEVFDLATGETHTVEHRKGEAFRIEANHIHRVVEVEPDTVTLIVPGEWVQQPGFYQWRDGLPFYRQWDWPDYKPVEQP